MYVDGAQRVAMVVLAALLLLWRPPPTRRSIARRSPASSAIRRMRVLPRRRSRSRAWRPTCRSTATTTSDGTYLVVNLRRANTWCRSKRPGSSASSKPSRSSPGARSRLDLSLAVGSIGETVTVEGVTPLLSTENAVLGTVVDSNEMDKLPLAIRNWDDLLALVPGVQSDRYTEQAGGTSAGRTGGVSVHGNRSLQNNFLLDGVANNSFSTNVQELTTQMSRPSVDAIDEFKVVTSPYAAEYGWSPGAAIIVNTKSGTNTLRGTAYDFFRNDSLDAINYFAKRANQPKPTNNQNQFGGNLGGPIVRNRAFFFGDFEGTRIEQGVLRTGRVMTADERAASSRRAIRDPLTGPDRSRTTRFPPIASIRWRAQHHRRCCRCRTPPAATTSSASPTSRTSRERYLARVDLPLGNDNLFARYICSDRFRYVPGWFGGVDRRHLDLGVGPQLPQLARVRRRLDQGARRFARQRVALLVRARHQRRHAGSVRRQTATRRSASRACRRRSRVVGGIVGIDITGHIRLGSPNFMPKFQHTNQFQYLNTLTWLRGRHQVKFGADVMMPMKNEYFDVAPTRGNLRFNGQFTGNAFADFLLGYAQRAAADQRVRRQAAAVVDVVLRAGRLEGDRRAHAQPWACATTS